MEIVFELKNIHAAAQTFLDHTKNKKVFAIAGNMGAGKTTFIKALCEQLGVKDVVSSPTFSIVNEYSAGDEIIYHFDFYRIKNLQEAYDIGYEEYFYSGNICLLEWPERVAELLPESYVKVEITALSPEKRAFTFSKINL